MHSMKRHRPCAYLEELVVRAHVLPQRRQQGREPACRLALAQVNQGAACRVEEPKQHQQDRQDEQ
jgi:hypothetical protein